MHVIYKCGFAKVWVDGMEIVYRRMITMVLNFVEVRLDCTNKGVHQYMKALYG